MSQQYYYDYYKSQVVYNLNKLHSGTTSYVRPQYAIKIETNTKSEKDINSSINSILKINKELSKIQNLLHDICDFLTMKSQQLDKSRQGNENNNITINFNDFINEEYIPCSDEENEIRNNDTSSSSSIDDFDIYSHFGIDPDDEFAESILEACMGSS